MTVRGWKVRVDRRGPGGGWRWAYAIKGGGSTYLVLWGRTLVIRFDRI